jgi:glucose-1-phosphate thymidylyltransferase
MPMQVVIPVAGLGTRLRPHTYSKPKPLVSVAGKPVLGHVLDMLKGLDVEEIIFITGYLGDQIEEYVRTNYAFPVRFVEQKELNGQSPAINLTRDFVHNPILIIFVDTIVETDLGYLKQTTADGVMYVKEVADPQRFGVAVLKGDHITKLVEKPTKPVSNLAVVGVYYLRDHDQLFSAIDEQMAKDVKLKGEYFLAGALQIMIDRGAKIEARPVEVWEDCGTADALLQTNRYILSKTNGMGEALALGEDSIVIPPSYVSPTAKVRNSIVGPYVSIADNTTIVNSIVKDSIISDGSTIEDSMLQGSLIGNDAHVKGTFERLNVGDLSSIVMG